MSSCCQLMIKNARVPRIGSWYVPKMLVWPIYVIRGIARKHLNGLPGSLLLLLRREHAVPGRWPKAQVIHSYWSGGPMTHFVLICLTKNAVSKPIKRSAIPAVLTMISYLPLITEQLGVAKSDDSRWWIVTTQRVHWMNNLLHQIVPLRNALLQPHHI